MGTHPIFESDFDCLTDGTDGLNRLVRSESRRRLPDPPSGVEPVTLQSQFHSANESVQLEQRMQAIKKRVEALDREEKELDQRLKELQLKDCYEINGDSKYNTNGTYINMRCEQPKYALETNFTNIPKSTVYPSQSCS